MTPLIALSALFACGDPPVPPPPPEGLAPEGEEFMVVVLPDTQIYAQRFPETFDAQLRWVAEHADEYNIVFVSHVGDIVNHGDSEAQWAVAKAAYDWLEDRDIPHGFSIGGHDFWVGGSSHDSSCSDLPWLDCDMSDFMEQFGPAEYADKEWYAGASPSGRSSYQRIAAGGLELLFLHLPQDTPAAEVTWAHEILDANPGTLAHLTTHRYLFDYRLTEDLPPPLNLLPAGRFNSLTYLIGDQRLMFHDSPTADELFTDLVAAHPNLWGVHCGHVDAEFHQPDTNSADLPVYEVLVDFQNMADGGGGWMRLLKFKPADDEVEVFTYSPVFDAFRANGDGFEHSIELLETYQNRAAEELADLGFDFEVALELLEAVKQEGTQERADYYESLYGGGQRDSHFTLSVDFQAYVDASR